MIGAHINGFRKNIDEKRMIELMDKYDIKYNPKWPEDSFNDALYNEEFGGLSYLGEEDVLGHLIATNSDYAMEETATSIEELDKKAKEVKETIKEVFGEDVDVKLVTGEFAC
jgi:hypothetical protein